MAGIRWILRASARCAAGGEGMIFGKAWGGWVFMSLAFGAGNDAPAFARGGGGPPVWTMTANYCRETVYNRGVSGADRFEAEVRKCIANPVTYPPAYK